jgi:hypothetical protein
VGTRLGGSAGNSRLTALTAIVLLVLLAIEGGTLLSLQTFLSWHIVVGMLLVPIVALKLVTVGYRLARYYTNRREYVEAGPPTTLLRLLGPVVVLATVGLFATGVALAVLGPGAPFVLLLHKASFAVWVAAMTVHVLAHVLELPPLAGGDLRGDGVGGNHVRVGLLAGVIVAGAVLAIATLPLVSPWVHWMRDARG